MLIFPHKRLRAWVVRGYLREAGYTKAVLFTCGNAAAALRAVDPHLDLLTIGPRERLVPAGWFAAGEIRRLWPDRFDATCGHLPAPLMARLAAAYAAHLGTRLAADADGAVRVPTGSGETILCLRWAYPGVHFVPVFNLGRDTRYHPEAPLLPIVLAAGGAEGLDGDPDEHSGVADAP